MHEAWELIRTAYHEAGHAVALHLLGHRVCYVFIGIDGDETAGLCIADEPELDDDPGESGSIDPDKDPGAKTRLDERAVMMLAGLEAQTMFRPDSREQLEDELGQVRDRLAHCLVEHRKEARQAYAEEMCQRTRALLQPAVGQVTQVAEELLAYRILSGSRVAAIVPVAVRDDGEAI
jgi:hypothetical protein